MKDYFCKYDAEIDLKEVFFFILKKWSLFLCSIIGGIFFGGILFIAKSSFIWLLFGTSVVFFMYLFFMVLFYVNDPCIKTVEDIQRYLHIPLMAHVRKQQVKNNSKMIYLLEKAHEKIKPPYNTLEYVLHSLEVYEGRKILICGDLKQGNTLYLSKCIEKSSNVCINFFLNQRKKEISFLKECEGVILIAQVGMTKREVIQREKEICDSYSIPIIGVILID